MILVKSFSKVYNHLCLNDLISSDKLISYKYFLIIFLSLYITFNGFFKMKI